MESAGLELGRTLLLRTHRLARRALNQLSYQDRHHPSHIHTKSSSLYPHISPLPPPHFYRPTPIIPTLTFHMPKPPQSTPAHHLINALHTQKTVQIHTAFPILQRHPAHPSPFRSLQTSQIRFLQHPGSVPYVNALWSQALYIFPFMRYGAPLAVRIGDNPLNFAQAHLTLALAASSMFRN